MSIGPQLSSVSTALTDLTQRIEDLASTAADGRREDVASTLFEVERLLKTAGRRLDQVMKTLR